MKVVAVNIAFREESFYKRWRLLSKEHGCQVTLVGPEYYEYHKFGKTLTWRPSRIEEPNFSVYQVNMRQRKWLRNDWWSWKFLRILIQKKPNIIYLIGYETKNVAILALLYKIFFRPNTKLGLFTMRGIDMPLNGIEYRIRWNFLKKHFDFVNVHYPHGRELIKNQGKFSGVINLQTQIGFDRDIFYPSKEYRDEIRREYGIGNDEFVFGAAVRIEAAKGVFEILAACEIFSGPFKFMLMGDGVDFEKVQAFVRDKNLTNKVILTGKIAAGKRVAMHMNALDCFVHVPKTTKTWVDTFPLAVVQAMGCGIPVIGSNSGAVPYQIGNDEMIVSEGNAMELAKKMAFVMDNPKAKNTIGPAMLKRALECFEIRHLNGCLFGTFSAVLKGEKVVMEMDQTSQFSTNKIEQHDC